MSAPLSPLESAVLALIPAAPESALTQALAGRLPETAPAAPWRCTFDGLVWVQRCGAGVASVLPAPLGQGASARWLVGAFVHYTDSPVGPYSEVFAALLLREGYRFVLHTPFMAVDSLESLRAGRANWALPKTLATFDRNSGPSGVQRASGEGWQVSAQARGPFGPRLPLRAALTGAQVRPDQAVGRYKATIGGFARPCRVEVDVASNASLARWVPPGRHVGLQWSNASLTVSAPRPTPLISRRRATPGRARSGV